jgi:hypothetical protein
MLCQGFGIVIVSGTCRDHVAGPEWRRTASAVLDSGLAGRVVSEYDAGSAEGNSHALTPVGSAFARLPDPPKPGTAAAAIDA